MLHYEKNTLATVVFRVDFAEQINTDNEKIREKCQVDFPFIQSENVSEQTINTTIDEKGEANVERQINKYINVTYSNRQMNRKVVISPKFFTIELQDYISYEDTKSKYMSIFSIIREENPNVIIKRIGMRYINQIDLSVIKKSARDKYVRASLLNNPLENNIEGAKLSRTQNLMEIMIDDFRVRCVTGYFNPDFPAEIKRYVATLDYDAYIHGNADVTEVGQYLDKFHDAIQSLFEGSILTKQKECMGIINE